MVIAESWKSLIDIAYQPGIMVLSLHKCKKDRKTADHKTDQIAKFCHKESGNEKIIPQWPEESKKA